MNGMSELSSVHIVCFGFNDYVCYLQTLMDDWFESKSVCQYMGRAFVPLL